MTTLTTPTLRVHRLDDRAVLPEYHSERAAGLDLAVCLPRHEIEGDSVVIHPAHRGGTSMKLPLGFACAIPDGYEGQVRPRSGLALRHGLTVLNSPGTIDSDYRGSLGTS